MRKIVLISSASLFFALSGCASQWKNSVSDIKMSMPSNVENSVRPHVIVQDSNNFLESITGVMTLDSVGEFGILQYHPFKINFTDSKNGLIEIRKNRKYTPSNKPIAYEIESDATSVCGIVDVLREEHFVGWQNVGSGTVVGGLYIMVNNGTQWSNTVYSRLDRIDSSTTNLCSILPGLSFSFNTQEMLQRKIRNTHSTSNMEMTDVRSNNCVVDQARYPATSLHPSIKGEYLKVACNTIYEDSKNENSIYAFLIDSKLYLPLEKHIQLNEMKYNYSEAKYRK